MGFFSPITKPFKKAANKIIKPFQKVSDKLLPNELRPLLPYATMFLPGSGILGAMGGAGGFAKMYAANMLTQAMADPEAEFEDLNQLSGILSGAQGALSGADTAGNLRNMTTERTALMDQLNNAPTGLMDATSQNTAIQDALTNRTFLTKAKDLALNAGAATSDYLTGNINTLQDVGSGRVDLFDSANKFANARGATKALAPSFAQASGDVAVNYQRPAMREYERLDAEEQAEIERTSTADRGKRANLQMKFMRQAGIPEETVEETLEVNDLGDLYTPPVETAAYGGLMGRNDYEFGGIIDAIKNIESREMMNQNKDMGGMMNDYNMGGRVGYAFGDFVKGSGVVQPVSASMRSGDRPMMGGSGMGGMLSNMINNNPQIFSNSNMSTDFVDLNQNGVDDRKETSEGDTMNGYNMGGSVLPQGMEMDYRGGGFIPMGSKERADDVPARVSKNEFVMTADAVRAAGGGSVNQGAKRMYDLMNNLEAKA